LFHGVQNDEVPQNVPLDGEQEGRTGTFQTLKQIGAATTVRLN